MKRVIFLNLTLLGIFLLANGILFAQIGARCRMDTVSVNKIQGRAYLVEANKDIPNDRLPEIKLELSPIDDSSQITPVELNDKGYFEMSGLRKGEYRLKFRFIIDGKDTQVPYYAIIKLKRSNAKQSGKSIDLALSWLNCFDYSIRVVKR